MSEKIVDGLLEQNLTPAVWRRSTVADGSWLQKYTLDKLSARDVYIASSLDHTNDRINTLEAATDVINVYGTWDEFTGTSGDLFDTSAITDNDVIKVLNDPNEYLPELSAGSHQTYHRWVITATGPTAQPLDPASGEWRYIGYADPYYNRDEIDEIIINVSSEFDDKIESLSSEIYEDISEVSGFLDEKIDDSIEDLSGTISSNYYKKGSITTGKNIDIVAGASPDNPPTLIISTKDNVSFDEVTSTGFSGTNISGGNNTATIENLITSAEGGSAANAWLNNNTTGNSAKYALSSEKVKWVKGIDNKYRPIGFANSEQEAQWTAGNAFYDEIVYDSAFNYNPYSQQLNVKYISANTVSANLIGTADKATSASKAEHTQDSLTSVGSGTNAILYVSSLNLSAGSGLKWSSAANTLGIGIDLQTTTVDNVVKISSIGGSALYSQVLSGGRCIEVNTADNSINLSSTVSAAKFYTTSTNLTNEINSTGLYFLSQSGPNASYTKLKNNEIELHYFTNNNNYTTNINSKDVSSTINVEGTSNTYTATWEDILKASNGDFTNKTISANLISTSSNGTSTDTTVVNAGNITFAGAAGGAGSTVTFTVTGITTPQGDISYTTLANMNYVSSNNTITAFVSASTVGTQANTVYLV